MCVELVLDINSMRRAVSDINSLLQHSWIAGSAATQKKWKRNLLPHYVKKGNECRND